MKILYAIQGTGNGHMSRAQVFIPLLKQYGNVDILISSHDHDITLSHPVKFRINGLGFTFGKNGGINYWKSFWRFKLIRFFIDMYQFPLNDYDVVINDFEPLTAWLCKLKKKKIVSLSHHSSYQSKLAPRPIKTDWFNEKVLKYHSPCNAYYSFHFKSYDANIFTPIIRDEITNAIVKNNGNILVYLPSYSSENLIPLFEKIQNKRFDIFCKHTSKNFAVKNIDVHCISEKEYINKLLNCEGVICNAGFETPAEAMYLGKKLLCVPMKGQYEQQCNAAALKQLGVLIVDKLDSNFDGIVKNWLLNSNIVQEKYPNQNQEIIDKVIAEFKLK